MKSRILILLFTLLSSFAFHPPHLRAEDGKRLLIINSYHDGAPWATEIMVPVIYDVAKLDNFAAAEAIYLNNALIHNEDDFKKMEDGLFTRFADRKPDYLVMIGNFAFTLRDRIVREWGDIPMLLVAQSDKYGEQDFYYTYRDIDPETVACPDMKPLAPLQKKYNFTLLHFPNLYEQTIDMMKYMFPGMNRLVFIADALYLNRHLSHTIREYLEEKYPGMEYEWLEANEENSKLLQQYLRNKDYNTGMLLSTWFVERMTIHGFPQLIAGDARMISSVKRPVFGLRYAYFSYGITGGFFPDPQEFNQELRSLLAEMIAGKRMSDIPFTHVSKSLPIVNYEKLVLNKIPESACPPDTEFINKPKTLWEQYYIFIIAAFLVIVAIVIVTVVILIFQRRRIEMLRDRARLVGNMPIGYSQARILRDPKERVIEIDYHGWNEMFGKILKDNEIPGKTRKIFESSEIATVVERMFRNKETIKFTHHFEGTDTDYEFLSSVSHISDRKDKELDIFAIDITDQKKKEEMLIEAREKAMEADKLKMAFLANMSHEIRTPLNAIVGFSTMLDKTQDPAKRARFVSIIQQNNEMLLKIINDVLDTAKIESNTLDVHPEPTDVNTLMVAVDNTVRLRLPKGVVLNMVLGEPECNIITDSDRLSQILVNLLTNAMKFTSKGSITFGYEVRETEIYFYVRDTGKGIAPADMGKLFTRFTKLNNFVQGTGLGLSISKSIVERMGGTIGATSGGENKGSLFWFTLPYPGSMDDNKNKTSK